MGTPSILFGTRPTSKLSLSVGVSVRQINTMEILVFVGDRYRHVRIQTTRIETLYIPAALACDTSGIWSRNNRSAEAVPL